MFFSIFYVILNSIFFFISAIIVKVDVCENGVLLSNGERAGAETGGEIGRSGGWTMAGRGTDVLKGYACGPAQGVNVACRSALRLSQQFYLT